MELMNIILLIIIGWAVMMTSDYIPMRRRSKILLWAVVITGIALNLLNIFFGGYV